MKLQPPLVWPCLLLLVLASAASADSPRGILDPPTDSPATPTDKTTSATTSATESTSTTTQATVSTPTTTTTQETTTAQENTSTTPTTTQEQTTSQQQTTTTPPPETTPVPGASPPATSVITDGDVIITTTLPVENTSTGSAAPATTSQSSDDDSDGGLSTGSIIGMSVAAGVAVLGIIGFFVWKFTRKRFSDFDDSKHPCLSMCAGQIYPQCDRPDEAIKWPELNTHAGNDGINNSAQNVGRAGIDTGSEANLSRIESTSNYSTPDFGSGAHDPYAVPPLPHLNPNQPYRDDPSPAHGFYDPYRGPVPGTIESGTSDWQPEAYPMTQLGGAPGRASPAPDFHGGMYGRASPAPQVAYGGRASPGPQAAYGGRASPGPQAVYGRTSPGPQAAYTTGQGY